MIDVTIENFEQEVIAASMSQPVLVDFWAEWCGPCKALGPILEKLETAYGGAFKLAKINSDEEQQLAGAFGIRSIPTVVLLKNGQPVGRLHGERCRRARCANSSTSTCRRSVEEEEEAPELERRAPRTADPEALLEKLQHAVATDPANDDARFDYVKTLLATGREADARRAFEPVASKVGVSRKLDALARWLDAVAFAKSHPNPGEEDAKIAPTAATSRRASTAPAC
jgi:putative thioredoxin